MNEHEEDLARRDRRGASTLNSSYLLMGDTSMLFRKKPVVIEAMQFLNFGHPSSYEIMAWARASQPPSFIGRHTVNGVVTLHIPTLEGTMTAEVGDWIIRGVKGEFYPCKPDIFAATYEPAQATNAADCGSDHPSSPCASPSDALSSSSALSTLRTSLRALRDKMRQLSRDRFDQFQNQPETIIGISAACYGVFADDLDELLRDTPQEPTQP